MLVVQGTMFAMLVAWIAYFQWCLRKMQQQSMNDRTEAIAELKSMADNLMAKTATIAKVVGEDAMATASELARVTAGQLDGKIDQILSRFDEAAVQQQDVKSVVDHTNAVLHKELESSDATNTTTREQIDVIQEATTKPPPPR